MGGNIRVENTKTESFPASGSASLRFTFWIPVLALLLAGRVSVSRLCEPTLLTCKKMVLANLHSRFANLVYKLRFTSAHSRAAPRRDSDGVGSKPRPGNLHCQQASLSESDSGSPLILLWESDPRPLLLRRRDWEQIDLRKSLSLRNSKFSDTSYCLFLVPVPRATQFKFYFLPVCSSQAGRPQTQSTR